MENLGNLPSLPNCLPLKQGDVTSPVKCSIAMLNCVEVRVTPNMDQVYSGCNKRTIGYDVVRLASTRQIGALEPGNSPYF